MQIRFVNVKLGGICIQKVNKILTSLISIVVHFMKRVFFILLCLFGISFHNGWAQQEGNLRFTYQFTFQKDTSDVHSKAEEPFVLDVFRDHSSFTSLNKIVNDKYLDSLTKSIERAGGVDNITSINIRKPGGAASESVIYKFPDGRIRFQDKIAGTLYEYKEEMPSDWNILDSTTTYSGYNCQLATMQYGGRSWTAWFTTDIPIANGPYKFMGLPGLIVKMQDAKDECIYELTEVNNQAKGIDVIPKAEVVTKKEMKKMIDNSRNKSIAATISSMAGNGTVAKVLVRDKDGREISMEELQRRRQVAQRKNNNRIEIE